MIESVSFMSLDKARKLTPNIQSLMISILDLDERISHRVPKLSGYRSVLSLSFEDTSEETKMVNPGSWADDPEEHDHVKFCQHRGEMVPTLTDAKMIFDFVKRHHESDEKLSLLVHCKAGMSRSAAVAFWASDFTNAPMSLSTHTNPDKANPRVLRLLEKLQNEIPKAKKSMRP